MGGLELCILSLHKILLRRYRYTVSILLQNVRCITYNTAKVPTDFIIIFRVEEKERYVLWPKYFPHRERTLTINSTSTTKRANIPHI